MGRIGLVEGLILIVIGILYFLPSFLARKLKDFFMILLFNVLFGWTFIGWVIILIWAFSKRKK